MSYEVSDLVTKLGFLACLIGLSVCVWYILRTIQVMSVGWNLVVKNQEILNRMIAHGGLTHQMLSAQNWRDLPPDGRLMFRNALVEVLAEMDKEMPTRH